MPARAATAVNTPDELPDLKRIIWIGPGLLFLASGGCTLDWQASTTRIQTWALPDHAIVFPSTTFEPENEVFSDGERLIRLSAAVNEVVAFQLALRSERAGSVWGISLDDLRQGDALIPAERVTLFRQLRVETNDYPTWYLRLTPYLRELRAFPDILVPLHAPQGALPILLLPGQTEAVWADIHVPPGTSPGLYRSKMHVVTSTGSAQVLDLTLEVAPFALPATRHLATLVGIDTGQVLRHHLEVDGKPYAPPRLGFEDPAYPRATAILDAAVQLLHRHRCDPILRDVQPRRQVNPLGELELDWSDYDRLVAGLLDGTIFEDRTPVSAWPMPITHREPSPEAYGGAGTASYERMLVEYMRQCVLHFLERGPIEHHFVWLPTAWSARGDCYLQFDRLGRLLRLADTRLKAVCTLPPHSMNPYGCRQDSFRDVSAFAAIWAPPASLADRMELGQQREAGRETWLNPDRPPFAGSRSILAPATHMRSLAWQAYRFGCTGLLLDAVNDWTEDGRPQVADSERCLIWPGKPYGLEAPVPSIRLKRLRRGLQDYEYLWLLERNRRPAIAAVIAEDLFPFGGTGCYGEHFLDGRPNGWVSDPGAWGLALRLMARELSLAIADAGTAGPGDEGVQFRQHVEWARLAKAVRNVRIEPDGLRVKSGQELAGGPVTIEATVSVFNETPQPVEGRLVLAEAPEGWSGPESGVELERLNPARRTRRAMPIRADSVIPNVDGLVPVRLALQWGEEESRADGRLCLVISQRLARPIVVDGRLDDWPLGAGNVAGDFVLVGALDVPKQGRVSPDRPSQRTNVFVTHDAEALYLGFYCEDDRLAERRVAWDNHVRYDELWPTGDDLVEVLLDPTGRAVDPGALLHIVVKANGAVLTERGLGCLSDVAPHGDWPANVLAAVDDRSHPDRWTVEIRIPLAALDSRAEILGVNFARFLPRLGEYSSWSAARRHLYSPVTLGNLHLP